MSREKMATVMRHMETREKESRALIADLQTQINSLSSEKNHLAFQLEQLRSQQQVCLLVVWQSSEVTPFSPLTAAVMIIMSSSVFPKSFFFSPLCDRLYSAQPL